MTLFENFHFWQKNHGPKSAIMELGPSDVTEWPEIKNDVHIQILHRITFPTVYYMTVFDNFHFSQKFHIAPSGPKSAIMDLGPNPGVPVVRFFGSTIKVDLHPIESVCANFHTLFTIWTIHLLNSPTFKMEFQTISTWKKWNESLVLSECFMACLQISLNLAIS